MLRRNQIMSSGPVQADIHRHTRGWKMCLPHLCLAGLACQHVHVVLLWAALVNAGEVHSALLGKEWVVHARRSLDRFC